MSDLRSRRRPVPRLRILAVVLLAVTALFALGAAAELLRHPAPDGQPVRDPDAEDEAGGDPRDEVICPQEEPREGEPRDDGGELPLVVEVDSNVLYDCPTTFDGQTVRYTGEAVGAVLWRRGGAWVQLNDDIYAGAPGPLPAHRDYRGGNAGVGVFVPRALAEQIERVGDHGNHGTVLEVVGTFHRVDPVSAEVAVIRAESGRVVTAGEAFEHPPLRDRQIVAALLVPLALLAVLWERRTARQG